MKYNRCSGEFTNHYPQHETKPIKPYHIDDASLVLQSGNSTSSFNDRPDSMTTSSEKISINNEQLHIQDAYQAHPFRNLRKSFRYQPLRCLNECSCRCHQRSVVRSPRNLSTFLGDVFLGCSSLPWCFSSFAQCNEQSCRRSQTSRIDLRYFFPHWHMLTTVQFSMSFSLSIIPLDVSLRTRNTIPYDSPIFIAVQEGKVDEIRNLLCSGKASLNDIDPYGLGLLYVSSISQLEEREIIYKLTIS